MSFIFQERVREGNGGYAKILGHHFDWPIMMALTGKHATANTQGSVASNGFTKAIRWRIWQDEISVFGMEYPYTSSKEMKSIVHQSNSSADMSQTQYQQMLNAFVADYYSDLYLNGSKKFEVTELEQNFRALNFSTFSFGGTVAFAMCNAFVHVMRKVGYADEAIKQAIANIAVITMGSCENYNTAIFPPYCVHLVNADDKIISSYGTNMTTIEEHRGIEVAEPKNEAFINLDNTKYGNQLVYISRHPQPHKLMDDKGRIVDLTDGHTAPLYLAQFNEIYMAIASIIADNAVRNTQPIIKNTKLDEDQIAACNFIRPEYIPLPSQQELPALITQELKKQNLIRQIER